MSEPNKSRRTLLVVGLKALALLVPAAALATQPRQAEASVRRRVYRRRVRRTWW